jgi:hypothetical protein
MRLTALVAILWSSRTRFVGPHARPVTLTVENDHGTRPNAVAPASAMADALNQPRRFPPAVVSHASSSDQTLMPPHIRHVQGPRRS